MPKEGSRDNTDNPLSELAIGRRDVLKFTGVGAVGPAAYAATARAQNGLDVNIRQVNRPDFPEVSVFATVQNSAGDTITDLTKSDFSVSETRQSVTSTQAIETLSQPEEDIAGNISTSVVIDKSGSMGTGSRMQNAIDGGKRFVQEFGSGDEGLLIAFNESPDIRERWTTSESDLTSAIEGITSGGSTGLFDAVRTAANEAAPRTDQDRIGRSAVIVLADGQDNASSATLTEAIETASQANVPIYTIGLGNTINGSNLQQLATETGGRYYRSADGSDLASIYNDIAESITSEYKITYVTNDDTTDGKEREVRVEAASNGDSGFDTEFYEEPCAPLPTASFDFSPEAVVEGQEVSFDGTASQPNGGNLVSYEWDFNNDGSVDATGETVTHTYTKPGSYNINLTVEKTCGATDVEVKPIVVADEPVSVVDVTTNAPITEGETLEAEIELKNTQFDKENRSVVLQDFDGDTADAEPVQVGRGESLTITLEWDTEVGDAGTDDITIRVSDIAVKEEITIETAQEFVRAKNEKRDLATEIQTISAGLDETNAVNTLLTAITDDVQKNDLSKDTGIEAVERLSLGETATVRALEVSGPEPTPNGVVDIDLTRRMVQVPVEIGVSLILSKIALKKRLGGKLESLDPDNFDNMDAEDVNKLLGIIQGIDFSALAKETAGLFLPDEEVNTAVNKCEEIAYDIIDDIDAGLLETGADIKEAMEDYYEGFLEEVAERTLRPLLEDGINTPTDFGDIEGLEDDLSQLNDAMSVDSLQNGIDGSLSGAEQAFDEGQEAIETKAENAKSTMETLDEAADYFTLLGHIPTVIDWVGDLIEQANSEDVESQSVTLGAIITAVAAIEAKLAAIGTAVQGSGAVLGLFGLWQIRRAHGTTINEIVAGDPDPGLFSLEQPDTAVGTKKR